MTVFRSPLSLALLLAIAVATASGFLLISPDKILPIRWGFDLAVTQSAPRNVALLQMPAATVLLWGVCWAFLRFGNAERAGRNTRTVALILPIVTALFLVVQVLIAASGLR